MSLHLSDEEFLDFQSFIHRQTGIQMHRGKKALICGRLAKRLQQCGMPSYGDYFRFIHTAEGQGEHQTCIDLLTTNETYFFREPKHFDWLTDYLRGLSPGTQPLRLWSAACSSGEEAYSLAMVLAEYSPCAWQLMGSDISTRMLERARTGHYPMARNKHLPPELLKKYCLRGTGRQDGTFLITKALRERVEFCHINLNEALPQVGLFDVIFLRNVMIYFGSATKQAVVNRLAQQLRPGGFLCIGHSESLNDVQHPLQPLAPAIFRKPGTAV